MVVLEAIILGSTKKGKRVFKKIRDFPKKERDFVKSKVKGNNAEKFVKSMLG